MSTFQAIVVAWISMTGWSGNGQDLECAVQNAWFEAGSYEDVHYITRVVLNRVDDPRWPGEVCEVIWQDRQFSWTQDGKPDTVETDTRWKVRKLVKIIMTASVAIDNKIMDGSRPLYYHAHYVSPIWAKALCVSSSNKFHTFYRDCEK